MLKRQRRLQDAANKTAWLLMRQGWIHAVCGAQNADGYRWTMVNGEITFEDGEPTGALPGLLLRNGRG